MISNEKELGKPNSDSNLINGTRVLRIINSTHIYIYMYFCVFIFNYKPPN